MLDPESGTTQPLTATGSATHFSMAADGKSRYLIACGGGVATLTLPPPPQNCLDATKADLHELQSRGAEPELMRPWDGAGSRERRSAADLPVKPAVDRLTWPGPLERRPVGRIDRPARDEWLRMLAMVGQRAETFYCTWLDDVPGANGWRGDQGRDRLTPLAEIVTPHGVAGPVTPAV